VKVGVAGCWANDAEQASATDRRRRIVIVNGAMQGLPP
jgi:hypothetical protein